MGGIKGGMVEVVKGAEGKGRGEIERKIHGKSDKWNIREMSEIGGGKEGMVEGVKRAEGKGGRKIKRKIDENSEDWNIERRD